MSLSALALNCTLNSSPTASSTQRLADEVLDALAEHDISGSTVRVVDHDVKPGVELDMGDGDAWPDIRQQVLAADILVLATPTWLGQPSSVCQRVFERLDAELSETDDQGRPLTAGEVAVVAVVGNEDGAHHIISVALQALNVIGFTIPSQAGVYWNGEAMHKTDYTDLSETPETVATTTKTLAANAAHVAVTLHQHNYPAPS